MKNAVYAIVLSVSILAIGMPSVAVPMPHQMIINKNLMECSSFLPGDECMDCAPPTGWKISNPNEMCPENYSTVSVRGGMQGL